MQTEVHPGPPFETEDDVGLWMHERSGPASVADWQILDDHERARAERLHVRAVDDFVTAHAVLRRVLAGYVDVAPQALRFDRRCRTCGARDHGRPWLREGGPDFSLSHSGRVAAVAVSWKPAVGVDVERHGRSTAVGLAGALRAVGISGPPRAGVSDLLEMWTRHEASVKALGIGLGSCAAAGPADPPVYCRSIARWDELSVAVAATRPLGPLRPPRVMK